MVSAGGAEGTRPRRARGVARPPGPADVAVIAAMPVEIGYFLDLLTSVRRYETERLKIVEGMLGAKVVVVATSGLGRARARAAAELVVAGHRPSWLISAGFAGALDLGLQRNDVLLADEVVDLDGRRFAIDVKLGDHRGRIRTGRLLTVDAIARTAAEKAELARSSGALAVDMETFALAELSASRNLRFVSMRVISDDATADLPPEIASLTTRSGSYQVGAALRALWHRPAAIKDFWRLHAQSQSAADTLATYLAGVIERLG